MTVKNIIDIFGFISIDDINLPIGSVFYITDKEDSYALIVDDTIDDKLICKLYGGKENESVL